MLCTKAEEWLSEYMEFSLTADQMAEMAEHLKGCPNCSALLTQMRAAADMCRDFPELKLSPELMETILLRTSGRPRSRSFGEIFRDNLLRPLLTPRFAVGAAVAVLFLVVSANLIMPRISVALSALSPSNLLTLMDRGVQKLYGQGLKAYDVKNQWEDEFAYFKKTLFDRFRYMMEQIDAPVEGSKKPEEAQPQKRKVPGESNTGLLDAPA
jgi:hypothetical protein